ncbi:MAG TPA: superoxide dismutase [Dehalococcoidia bacterium]|nr:superoxide dismutase [Dehalococcoidia bacterium]
MPWTAKELKPAKELAGISRKQIEQHHDVLYRGYVNKLNEIESKLPTAPPAEANATYSLIRELKREEVFATQAIRLHEGYFQNLGGDGVPKGTVLDLIKEDLGSYEKWEEEFRALGIAARGWVVLVFDWADKKLRNYLSDIHSDGVWSSSPLLILDVYEHAYFIDYGTGRKAYIEAFMKNVNWDVVNQRVKDLNVLEHRRKKT